MGSTSSTLSRLLMVLGLVAVAAATQGCKAFERDLNAWEAPEDPEDSAFFSLTGTVEVETRTTGSLPDHDGYSIWHEQTQKLLIGIDETIVVNEVSWDPGLFPRWYLGKVSPHCKVLGGTRFPERPETWYLGRWFLSDGGTVKRTVDVNCEPSD